jgi:hypothetical protein
MMVGQGQDGATEFDGDDLARRRSSCGTGSWDAIGDSRGGGGVRDRSPS